MAGRKNRGKWRDDPSRAVHPQRPAFDKGNKLGLVHGGRDPDQWKPIAAALAAELPTVAPWTARPAFAATVAAWSKAEAQAQLVGNYLNANGLLDDEGTPRPATSLYAQAETRAANLRQQLGLTPLALAKLLQALAAVASISGDESSLEAVRAEGRRIAQAQQDGTVS
jgi:hypothetical protein